MSATTDRSAAPALAGAAPSALARAEGLELLGEVDGSGYAGGSSLVRRADGQVVQLGPLLYSLLEEVDGERAPDELAAAMCERLGRPCDEEHVLAIAQRLAAQGLLAGYEANAPERSNPLLALRWKVVVTDPARTARMTAPFTWLFRPWLVLPVLVAFAAACWFVLVEQGVAGAAAQAFDTPELILMLVGLGVAAAAFHELGHAAACRYGGGTPGAMGAGIYLVWPAFYTDVTDAYRLPRRDRLRTDLGGLYFNAIVAVATMATWLVLRVDALLLLIGLQLVAMVRQLSPVIRADGYHILADVTGVPDLYAHIVPTLKGLLPGRREPSALTGRARVIVTAWVLVVVPVLISLALGAVLLLPRIAASSWEGASAILAAMPDQAGDLEVAGLALALVRLLALTLPVLGATVILWRLVSGGYRRAAAWSDGRPERRLAATLLGAAVVALLAWAWWPDGQYRPIRASDGGTILQLGELASSEEELSAAASVEAPASEPAPSIADGTHLAVSLVPEGGASAEQPAIFVITDADGDGKSVAIVTDTTPGEGSGVDPDTGAAAFPFELPDAPREGDNQALAYNQEDGGVLYEVAYSLVTVSGGEAVDNENGAHAYANCDACTTVAVSFQVVLVVGSSPFVAPVNIAEALNGNCPACVTTAIANQIVVSIGEEPSEELLAQLMAELERLEAIDELELAPSAIMELVTDVHADVNAVLEESGIVTGPDTGEEAAAEEPATDPEGEAMTEEPVDSGDAVSEPTTDPDGATTDDGTTTDEGTTDDATTDETTTEDTTAGSTEAAAGSEDAAAAA